MKLNEFIMGDAFFHATLETDKYLRQRGLWTHWQYTPGRGKKSKYHYVGQGHRLLHIFSSRRVRR